MQFTYSLIYDHWPWLMDMFLNPITSKSRFISDDVQILGHLLCSCWIENQKRSYKWNHNWDPNLNIPFLVFLINSLSKPRDIIVTRDQQGMSTTIRFQEKQLFLTSIQMKQRSCLSWSWNSLHSSLMKCVKEILEEGFFSPTALFLNDLQDSCLTFRAISCSTRCFLFRSWCYCLGPSRESPVIWLHHLSGLDWNLSLSSWLRWVLLVSDKCPAAHSYRDWLVMSLSCGNDPILPTSWTVCNCLQSPDWLQAYSMIVTQLTNCSLLYYYYFYRLKSLLRPRGLQRNKRSRTTLWETFGSWSCAWTSVLENLEIDWPEHQRFLNNWLDNSQSSQRRDTLSGHSVSEETKRLPFIVRFEEQKPRKSWKKVWR